MCIYVCVFLNVHSFVTTKTDPTLLWKVIFRNEELHPFPMLQHPPLTVKLVWVPLATMCTTDACWFGFCADQKFQNQLMSLFIFKLLCMSQNISKKLGVLEQKVQKQARLIMISMLPIAFCLLPCHFQEKCYPYPCLQQNKRHEWSNVGLKKVAMQDIWPGIIRTLLCATVRNLELFSICAWRASCCRGSSK